MQKIEKSKKKNKDMSKESSNEKEEAELRKVADKLYNTDMNHFKSDNELEESDVEPEGLAEQRNEDGNIQEVEKEADKKENDVDVDEPVIGQKQDEIPGESKNRNDKTENLGQAKKNKKKDETKGKGKNKKSSKRRHGNSNPDSDNDERSTARSRKGDDEESSGSDISSVTDISMGKKEKRVHLKFEHYDPVFFPFKEEWQKPEAKLEWGQRVIVERDEVLREKRVTARKRKGEDLMRFRMFRGNIKVPWNFP